MNIAVAISDKLAITLYAETPISPFKPIITILNTKITTPAEISTIKLAKPFDNILFNTLTLGFIFINFILFLLVIK